MKKILSVLLLLTILSALFLTLPVLADEPNVEKPEEIFACHIYVGEETVSESARLVSGNTYVPLRDVCEKIGCNVNYDKDTNIATIQKGITIITIIDKDEERKVEIMDYATSDPIPNETVAIKRDGKLYIPLRDVLENLFCHVKYSRKEETEDKIARIDISSNYSVTRLNHENYALVDRKKYNGDDDVPEHTEKFVFDVKNMKKVAFTCDTNYGPINIEPKITTDIKDLLICKDSSSPAAFEITTKNDSKTTTSYFVIESGKSPVKYDDKLSLLDRNNSDILVKSENGWKKIPGKDGDPLTLTLPNSSFSVTYVPGSIPLLDKFEVNETELKNDKIWKLIFDTYKNKVEEEYKNSLNSNTTKAGGNE